MNINIYELFNFAHGNTDILSDIGGENEIRNGIVGFIPHSVGDEVINEDYVKFVRNRKKYPKEKTNNQTQLHEIYLHCVKNIKKIFEVVDNKVDFYDNLIKLQEYLQNHDNKIFEGMSCCFPITINENGDFDVNDTPSAISLSLTDRTEYAEDISYAALKKIEINSGLKLLGHGGGGFAYLMDDNRVFKLTADTGEVDASIKLMLRNPKYLAKPYAIYKIIDTEENKAYFGIIQEYIKDKPTETFISYRRIFDKISPFGVGFGDFFMGLVRKYNYNASLRIVNGILTENLESEVNENDRKNTYMFFIGILNIKNELVEFDIKSNDFSVFNNLGYDDGVLKFFDYGSYRGKNLNIDKENYIFLPEDVVLTEVLDRGIADTVADKLKNKLEINQLNYLGSGGMGVAYDIENEKVLKITTDESEAKMNLKLKNRNLDYIAIPYNVYTIKSRNNTDVKLYAIILEKLDTDLFLFERLSERLRYVFRDIFKIDIVDIFEYYVYGKEKGRIPDKTQLINYMTKNKEDGWFFLSLMKIGKELVKNGVSSLDFLQPRNLGFKSNGALAFFDLGMSEFNQGVEPEAIEIDEDGTSLYSTSDSVGRDDFPPYNQDNIPPTIENNLDANSSLYNEDLEYSKVSDATQDEFVIDEDRRKSYMDGSTAVTVKKKCRLGGNSDGTSTACNRGDINNLIFSKINENIDASEAYSENDALETIIDGKRGVGIIALGYDELMQKVDANNLKYIEVEQGSQHKKYKTSIVYSDGYEIQANQLDDIMKKLGGYVQDETPVEAYQIGKLLSYTDESIEKYVNRRYRKLSSGGYEIRNNDEIKQYDRENKTELVNENINEARRLMNIV